MIRVTVDVSDSHPVDSDAERWWVWSCDRRQRFFVRPRDGFTYARSGSDVETHICSGCGLKIEVRSA